MRLGLTKATVVFAVLSAFAFNALVHAQRGGRGAPAAPPSPRAAAAFDLSGQWVSLITEDWRQRQFTPARATTLPCLCRRPHGRSPIAGIRRKTRPPANN